MKPREHMETQLQHDTTAEKLDEMAELCEIWQHNREAGRMPVAVRHALVMICNEIALIESRGK